MLQNKTLWQTCYHHPQCYSWGYPQKSTQPVADKSQTGALSRYTLELPSHKIYPIICPRPSHPASWPVLRRAAWLLYSSGAHSDLSDILWSDEERIYFMDRNSVIQKRVRYVGAAVMILDSVVWITETSAQKAKLNGLTQALKLAKGTIANSYTDSRWNYWPHLKEKSSKIRKINLLYSKPSQNGWFITSAIRKGLQILFEGTD